MPGPQLGALVLDTSAALLPGEDSIFGKQVTLTRLSPQHIPDLYSAVGSQDKLWTFVADGPFSNIGDFTDTLNTLVQTPGFTGYATVPKSTNKATGITILFPADLTNRVIEVGLVLGLLLQKTRASTEAMYLLGKLVFEDLRYRRWECKCDSLNVASRRAAERYGFLYEGTFRQHKIVKGRNRDSAWYSMLDSEWGKCKKVFEVWLADDNFHEDGKQKRSLDQVKEYLKEQ